MSTKREQIIQLVKEYYRKEFESKKKDFEPGDKISYGGRFFNDEEMCALVDSSLDFWLTTGRYAARFEKEMAQFLNVRFCSLTNSGSSANLLAFMALTSPKLGDRRIKRGDEVITIARRQRQMCIRDSCNPVWCCSCVRRCDNSRIQYRCN